MPKKTAGNFFSLSSLFESVFFGFGIGIIACTFYNLDTIRMMTGDLPFRILSLFTATVSCLTGVWMTIDNLDINQQNSRCYYCGKKIWNFQKRIIVKWPEFTEYSRVEQSISKGMHTACHKTAAEKFRIPDPRFSSWKI